MHLDHLGNIWQQHGDRIVAANTQGLQGASELTRTRISLAPVTADTAIHHRCFVTINLSGPSDKIKRRESGKFYLTAGQAFIEIRHATAPVRSGIQSNGHTKLVNKR